MKRCVVEYVAGHWIVKGRVGCPGCPNRFEAILEIPEEFLMQMIEEGKRRQREGVG